MAVLYSGNTPPNNYGITVFQSSRSFGSEDPSTLPDQDLDEAARYDTRFLQKSGDRRKMVVFDGNDYLTTSATTGEAYNLPILSFPSGTTSEAQFVGKTSRRYGRRPFDVILNWTTDTTGTGNAVFGASVDSFPVGTGITPADFGGVTSGTFAVAESGSMQAGTIPMASSNMQGVGPAEHFAIKIQRFGGDAGDTYQDDVQLISVEIRESTSTGN